SAPAPRDRRRRAVTVLRGLSIWGNEAYYAKLYFFFAAFRAASFFALAPRVATAAFFVADFFVAAFFVVLLAAFFAGFLATAGFKPSAFFSGGVPGIKLPPLLPFCSANCS